MEHVKKFDDFVVNESLHGLIIPGIAVTSIVLMWINSMFAKFGTGNKRGGGWSQSWQRYPFKGLINYIRMSLVLKKYKKQLEKIDIDILKRDPDLKYAIQRLKEKGGPNYIDMTAPSFYYDGIIERIFESCNENQKDDIKKILKEFQKEMDDIFESGADISSGC